MDNNEQLNHSVSLHDSNDFIRNDLNESTDMKQVFEERQNETEHLSESNDSQEMDNMTEESEKDQSSEETVSESNYIEEMDNITEGSEKDQSSEETVSESNDIEEMDNITEGSDKDQSFEETVSESNDIEEMANITEGSEKDQRSEETVSIYEYILCDECGKSFPDKYSVSCHKSYIHKIEVSVCQICGNEFQNKLKLQKHVNSVHKDCSIQCEMCSKLFKNKSLLYGHKKVVHEVTENLFCPTCGIEKMNTYKLQKHLKRCPGFKQIDPPVTTPASLTCTECNKTFKTHKSLKDHYKFGHPSDFIKCQICQMNYKNIPSFKNHLQRAHGIIDRNHILALIKEVKPEFGTRIKKEKPDYQKQRRDLVQKWKEIEKEQNALKMSLKTEIQCNECEKSFLDEEKLNNHTKKNHTSDPCTCPFCGDTLDNKSYFTKHIKQFHKDISKTKKGDKKMKKTNLTCPTCGIKVINTYKLQRHLKQFCRGYKLNDVLPEEFPMIENDSLHIKTEEFVDIKLEANDEHQHLDQEVSTTEESQELDKSVASEDEQHSCPYCEGTVLKNKTYLKMHLDRFHDGYKLLETYKMEDEFVNIKSDPVDEDLNTRKNEFNEVIDAENKLEKIKHEQIKDFICNYCGKEFEQAFLLKRHAMVHDEQKPFGCSDCPKSFTSKAGIDYHKLSHTNESPFMCDVCSQTFRTKFCFKQHKLIHTGEKPHSCDACGKAFRLKDGLNVHKRKGNCTENKPLICDKCLKTFTYGANLKSHAKNCNNDKGDFMCPQCGINYKSNTAFQEHKCDTNPGEEENKICYNCGKECKNTANLKRHQTMSKTCFRTDIEGYVKCDECEKNCKSMWALHQHTFYAHPNSIEEKRVEMRVSCSLCGKEFRDSKTLRQHQRKTIGCSQTGPESRVECPECGKVYANKHALYSHNYSVHTIENVNCPSCGKICKNKLSLKLHLKRNCGSYNNTAKDVPSVQGGQVEYSPWRQETNSSYF